MHLQLFSNYLAPAIRSGVHLGIFDHPTLSTDELIKNFTKDTKSAKRQLRALQIIISIVQPEAVTLIAEIRSMLDQGIDVTAQIQTELMEKNSHVTNVSKFPTTGENDETAIAA